MHIPFFGLQRQYENLKDELLQATDDVLRSGQYVNGDQTLRFESWLTQKTKTHYAVVCHSGTQALEIIARYKTQYFDLQNIEGPHIVRVPNLTYPATAHAFVTAGYDVELVDTDRNGIIHNSKKDHRNPARGAVLECKVGLFGRAIDDYTTHNNIIVDGAQHWLVAGRYIGQGMAISFDPTKNLPSSGNGGAIVTNDHMLYLFASNYVRNGKPYFHDVGTNSRMSEIDCSHLLVRSKYLDEWQKRREQITHYWCDAFKDLPLRCLSEGTTLKNHAYQKFAIYSSHRNEIKEHLQDKGISVKYHYNYTLGDLDLLSPFNKPDMMSVSVMLSHGLFSLPLYPELEDSEVEYIEKSVKEFFE